jgi:twitching motility protein PilT
MLKDLVKFAKDNGASDLHISAGVPPLLRINGDIRRLEMEPLAADQVKELIIESMTEGEKEKYEKTNDVDYTCTIQGVARLRSNAFMSARGPAAVFRLIPEGEKTVEELGLPPAIKDILQLDRGFVLVTGPAGSGKSTTLATIVSMIAHNKSDHILTIEDPVEFIHRNTTALINHRELGTTTTSFSRALKSALREDPDVIVIGEMRDLETIQLALTAAETGHLVLGTLHTSSAAKTITRIIDVFPPDKQEQVRTMLAESIQLVVSQNLLKRKDGTGRVAAFELMISNTAIKNQIRESQIFQIPSSIEIGVSQGMQSMAQALEKLVEDGIIDQSEADKILSDHDEAEPSGG